MKMTSLKISLFIIITLSILVIVAGLLSYKNFIGLLGAWSQSNKMNIYLKIDTTEEDKKNIVALIEKNQMVTTVNIIDRVAAGQAFQRSLQEFSSGLITEDEMLDLIPETIEVDLKNTLNISERQSVFADLASQLKQQIQIEEVNYGASWLKKFEFIDSIVRSLGLFIILLLFVSMSYLVALMVRTYIEDSKQEIEVFSLLGATRWSIYQIFLKDIFMFLVISLAVSLALLYGAFTYLKSQLPPSLMLADNLRFLSTKELIGVTFLFFLFVYVNSFITIQSAVNRLNQLTHE